MVDLVSSVDLDVLLLQEVYRGEVADFAEAFEDAICSLDVERSDGHTSGKVGCAILAKREVRLIEESAALLYELPQPERGLLVDAVTGSSPIQLLSWHAPSAAQHGRGGKEIAYRAVTDTLAALSGTAVVGMDTNMWHDRLGRGRGSERPARVAVPVGSSRLATEARTARRLPRATRA